MLLTGDLVTTSAADDLDSISVGDLKLASEPDDLDKSLDDLDVTSAGVDLEMTSIDDLDMMTSGSHCTEKSDLMLRRLSRVEMAE